MVNDIRVVQVGLGYIGLSTSKIISERKGLEMIGAVDPDPAKANSLPGIIVSQSVSEALKGTGAEVAVLTTTSRMDTITPQVLELLDHGLHVVSTCEELVYPWETAADMAARINSAAIKSGVVVLSTGVNPGFLMDFLPVIVARIAEKVDSIEVERFQDAKPRREAFQRKIGAGLSVDEFEKRVAGGNFGHAGLTASVQLLAAGLGWKLHSTTETIAPVIAERAMQTDFLTIEPGQVAGVYQEGIGTREDRTDIRLVFRAAVGESEPHDLVRVTGNPPLEVTFPAGVHGDIATGAITVNAIPALMRLQPGLRTMADLWPSS
jgi:4-hydroxy-tetrahydrodipicolinate reductase